MQNILDTIVKIFKSLSVPAQILAILAIFAWAIYYIQLEMAEKPILKEILKEEIRIENRLAVLEKGYHITHKLLEFQIQFQLWNFYLEGGKLNIAERTYSKDICTQESYNYFDIKSDCRTLIRKGLF